MREEDWARLERLIDTKLAGVVAPWMKDSRAHDMTTGANMAKVVYHYLQQARTLDGRPPLPPFTVNISDPSAQAKPSAGSA